MLIVELNQSGLDLSPIKLPPSELETLPGESNPFGQPHETQKYVFDQERYDLELKIRYVQIHLPQIYEEFEIPEDIKSLSKEELQDIVNYISARLSVQTTGEISIQAANTGMGLFENLLLQFTPLKVKGLQQVCLGDPQFNNLIHEIVFENLSTVQTSPYNRLGFIILKSALTLHTINSQVEGQTKDFDQSVSERIINEFKDL